MLGCFERSWLLVFVVLMLTNNAIAIDPFQDLLRCKCRRALSAENEKPAVFLRTYPLQFESVSINRLQAPLASVLASNALGAQLTEHIQQLSTRSVNEGDKPLNEGAANLFLRGDSTTPNGLMVARENEITVFPRSFLAYPSVALLALQDGDAVATFRPDESAEPRDDPFYKFLIAAPAPRGQNPGVLIAPFASELVVTGVIEDWKLGTHPELSFITTDFEKDLAVPQEPRKAASDAIPQLPVFVVQRRFRGFLIRYIVPARKFGPFAEDGKIFRALFRDQEGATRDSWRTTFKGFDNLKLTDGDVIQFTDLRTIPLFREVAR
jgi:hypothetical protein